MIPHELDELAHACGVLTTYEDAYKRRREVSVESVLAALGALGCDIQSLDDVPAALANKRLTRMQRGIEPVIVAWDGQPVEFDLTLPTRLAAAVADCAIEVEDGSTTISEHVDLQTLDPQCSACGRFVTRRLKLGRPLPAGYHRLTIEAAGERRQSLLISAPRRAYAADSSALRHWGCFLPLYALRSQRNWGAGDFTDLHNLGEWIASLGGNVVGTLPLLAAFLDEPCEPSPYAPASRLAWNEFYVDVTRIPELADCREAAELVRSTAVSSDVKQLRTSELVDYRRIMALKRRVLEILADAFFQKRTPQRQAQFETFLRRHPHVEDYARFRATCERRREPWEQWPHPLRGGQLSESDYGRRDMQYHLYAQWVATTQLDALADAAGGGLYLDLPLGVRPDGYDVWRWNDAYANAASAGSPPEPMWTSGQNWGFPPLHPERIREQGYRHVRDFLAHHLRLARILRIDHVMQLHRLYWIPHGMRRDQGTYVRYRPEELYAILNIESHRCGTTLIGENLGTVPPEVNQAMDAHNLKPMYVVQYEVASPDDVASPHELVSPDDDRDTQSPGDAAAADTDRGGTPPAARTEAGAAPLRGVPAGSLATLNTHDMPMFEAWWTGAEISLRQQLGLLEEDEARHERKALETMKAVLTAWLRTTGWLNGSEADDGLVLRALQTFLAASDASVVMVNLEDLWLETRPQNVPGTGPELPNWKRKAAVALEDFARRPDIREVLCAVAKLRGTSNEVNDST